ncbi:MAG: hypothetical protein AVDCRST_MAG59-4127, partial [uncultured Thermomicrobiales bacterium]
AIRALPRRRASATWSATGIERPLGVRVAAPAGDRRN